MHYVFQNDIWIYFLMDYVRGGEMFSQILMHKRFPDSRVKFYAAQVALALGYLHSQSIIYWDLKPENILIYESGYICLADFGLSRILNHDEVARTFVGTAEYLSPEIIQETGHHHGADWWALGILLYEMAVGIPPFYHKNWSVMYKMILERPPRFPDRIKHGIDIAEPL